MLQASLMNFSWTEDKESEEEEIYFALLHREEV